jgi:serine/threonine protein phosphatase PrpC
MVIVEPAGLTDVGKKRKANEDSLSVDSSRNLYVVADGMGGHKAGEVASRMVVDTVQDYMNRFDENHDVEELPDADKNLSKPANRLLAGINLANRGVYHASCNNAAYQGMGSTISAVYFTDTTYIAANVGDSPIYLVQNNNIELLSVPHTIIAEQEALHPGGTEQLSKEFSHMLTRGMGIQETVQADICENTCFAGDILVICSDGLSDKLTPDDIFDIVKKERPARACRELVYLANERGGEDNITVIIIKVKKVKHAASKGSGIISRILRHWNNISFSNEQNIINKITFISRGIGDAEFNIKI